MRSLIDPYTGVASAASALSTRFPSRVSIITVSPAKAARRTLGNSRNSVLTFVRMSNNLSYKNACVNPDVVIRVEELTDRVMGEDDPVCAECAVRTAPERG